jgi:hypothetical protein
MNLFTARAKRGKLKYYDDHISFTLDGAPEYDWRKIQSEIIELKPLSLPKELIFKTSKCSFGKLNELDWPKSGFRLPIIHKRLLTILDSFKSLKYEVFPIRIVDSKNETKINDDFVALYLTEQIDCVDRDVSVIKTIEGNDFFEYTTASFRQDIVYPPIFKIKDISTPFMHFTNDINRDKLIEMGVSGIDFEDIVKTGK